jgi:hypothetical protein
VNINPQFAGRSEHPSIKKRITVMSNGSTVATSISTFLSGLNPGQLLKIRNHLTQSQEMQALQDLAAMQANPALAPSLLAALAAIPNLPPAVLTWVTAGLAQPANFQTDIAQAEAALQAAAVNPGVLGSLGL